jgi:hypothetical protein
MALGNNPCQWIVSINSQEWLCTSGSDDETRLKDLDPAYAEELRSSLDTHNVQLEIRDTGANPNT